MELLRGRQWGSEDLFEDLGSFALQTRSSIGTAAKEDRAAKFGKSRKGLDSTTRRLVSNALALERSSRHALYKSIAERRASVSVLAACDAPYYDETPMKV